MRWLFVGEALVLRKEQRILAFLVLNLSWQSCGEAAYWDWKNGIGQYAPKGVYNEGSALLLYIFTALYFTFFTTSTLHFCRFVSALGAS